MCSITLRVIRSTLFIALIVSLYQVPVARSQSPVQEIDLLVAYTTEAKTAKGAEQGILTLIDQAVADTNAAFQNSEVAAHVNLVHAVETLGFVQASSYDTDINRLRNPNDPSLFILHQLRQEHRADVVILLAAPRDYAGLGKTMRTPSLDFRSSAFAIVSTEYAVVWHSFAHELGHILGAAHERGSSNNNGGSYPFSFGYRSAAGNWCDIMGIGCSRRIQNFSNPNVLAGGLPTGVAEGDPLAADNAKTMNLNASYVSYFKDTSGATFTVSGTVRDAESGEPLEGVSIPSGGPLGQTVTNQNGVYSFDAIPPGAPYNIVPSFLGYDFSPVPQSGTVNGDLVIDFVGVENLPNVGPDLQVEEGKISGKLYQGFRLKFKAKVFNRGTQSVLASRDLPQLARLRLCLNVVGPGPYNDCFFVASKAVSGTLKPQRSKTVSFSTPWTAVHGDHAYEICADKSAVSGSPHRVLETNEQNNCLVRKFSVQ